MDDLLVRRRIKFHQLGDSNSKWLAFARVVGWVLMQVGDNHVGCRWGPCRQTGRLCMNNLPNIGPLILTIHFILLDWMVKMTNSRSSVAVSRAWNFTVGPTCWWFEQFVVDLMDMWSPQWSFTFLGQQNAVPNGTEDLCSKMTNWADLWWMPCPQCLSAWWDQWKAGHDTWLQRIWTN